MNARTAQNVPPGIPEALSEEAASWIVQLSADDEAERLAARQGFEAWKQADPRHAQAAAAMERLLGQFQHVGAAAGQTQPAHVALDAAFFRKSRPRPLRRAGIALAVACALALPVWMNIGAGSPGHLLADLRTFNGERQTRTLPDGTLITLDSASAVNVHYDAQRRTVELLMGEIRVDVAKDASRPFLVESPQGSIRALGTRFLVERQGDATVLSMLESRVAVRPSMQPAVGEGTVVSAGQRVRITAQGVGQVEDIDSAAVDHAWQAQMLVVNRRPLSEVLDELDRHRRGHIRYDRAQLAGIEVSVVLPLDDTDRALQLLAASFPALRVRSFTPYLVLVDMPQAQ